MDDPATDHRGFSLSGLLGGFRRVDGASDASSRWAGVVGTMK
ncbi:hypothetical protein [Rhodococcus artemisiae]|uniref:Uncharacterized protein n=1 Tax=Rhodococcus artemisiae TaxID=714159 RepID=A0ABU7LBE6_9NOCA|nr:hypothetical protein [Rhodococcus artemisiae]MEE2058866.1 hypothetical protein [Rhodococcus artemisiae]